MAIVDGDASVRRSLQPLVRSAGYAVETFASARDFLAWLPNGQAACLVLDVHMKEINGFELQKKLAPTTVLQRRLRVQGPRARWSAVDQGPLLRPGDRD